jgi:hypothetical protein
VGAALTLAGVMCLAGATAFSSPSANKNALQRSDIGASSSDDTFGTTPPTSVVPVTTPSTAPSTTTPSTAPSTTSPSAIARTTVPSTAASTDPSTATGAYGSGSEAVIGPDMTRKEKRELRRSRRADLAGVDSGSLDTVARGIITEVDALSGGRYSIPADTDNIGLFAAWMENEGGLWANNPLNTSLDASRYAHQFNGDDDTGIPIYPTISIGIVETAKTLLDFPAYSHILAVLSTGHASCTTFGTAVEDSPWASSHYGYDPSRFCQA